MDFIEYTAALSAAAVMAIAGYWMGIQSVMTECRQGGGSWLIVIEHHWNTIECRRETNR